MSDYRRQPNQGRQNRDDRNRGRQQGGSSANVALQIITCAYNPSTETLEVEVQAVLNAKPARSYMVELLVDDRLFGSDTTNYSGRIRFLFTKKIQLGKHRVVVRSVGEVGRESENLIIQASDILEVLPPSLVPSRATLAHMQCVVEPRNTMFTVQCTVTSTRDGIPCPHVEVEIEGLTTNVVRLQTNDRGLATTEITIPFRESTSKFSLPYQVIVPESGAADMQVLVLEEPPRPIPETVTFDNPVEQSSLGTYHVRTVAEDAAGQPLQGVRFTVTGKDEPQVYVTDRYGVTTLVLVCYPDKDQTNFVVDIPGVKKHKRFDLMSERGRHIRIVNKEVKLPLGAKVSQHMRQAFKRGAGDIRYTKPVSEVSPELKVEPTPTDAPAVEVVAEVLPPRNDWHHEIRMEKRAQRSSGFGFILAIAAAAIALFFVGMWTFDLVSVQALAWAAGLTVCSAFVTWLLFRNQAQALRYLHAHRRQIGVYGIVRPTFGFLGFCWGTNNRRSNVLLYVVLPALFVWIGWVAVHAIIAYIQHPIDTNLPNVVSGTKTELANYREVPMHLSRFLVLVAGTLLATLVIVPYWFAARREEIERSWLYIKHRFQTDEGEVVSREQSGLIKKWAEAALAKYQMHPLQHAANTVHVGAAPAPAPHAPQGIPGHTLALSLLTAAEVFDWILTIGKMMFGGKK